MLWPCGLGYQLLSLHCYSCSGTNLIHNHLLWARPHHVQHLFHTGQERITAQTLLQQMATLAGIEVHLSPSG